MQVADTPILHVCLIDDDPDHVIIITRAIRGVNPQARVKVLVDGDEALAWLHAEEQRPDLILLDINMPGLSGLDVLERIKTDPQLKLIPVVMLTSSELASDVVKAYELGASGYISKGSYLHDLRATLGNTLLYWSAMKRVDIRGESIQ
jgi:CheY-like chemotaxis protein